jgi:hypothetical protein
VTTGEVGGKVANYHSAIRFIQIEVDSELTFWIEVSSAELTNMHVETESNSADAGEILVGIPMVVDGFADFGDF